MIWPRILVFTSMMLRVLTPAAFGSYGAGFYIPKLGLVPKHTRPVRPVANLYALLATRPELNCLTNLAQALPKGLMVIPLKVGFSPELLVQPLNPIGGSL